MSWTKEQADRAVEIIEAAAREDRLLKGQWMVVREHVPDDASEFEGCSIGHIVLALRGLDEAKSFFLAHRCSPTEIYASIGLTRSEGRAIETANDWVGENDHVHRVGKEEVDRIANAIYRLCDENEEEE